VCLYFVSLPFVPTHTISSYITCYYFFKALLCLSRRHSGLEGVNRLLRYQEGPFIYILTVRHSQQTPTQTLKISPPVVMLTAALRSVHWPCGYINPSLSSGPLLSSCSYLPSKSLWYQKYTEYFPWCAVAVLCLRNQMVTAPC
jgi:hypothetical protein